MANALTPKQEKFCQVYIETSNASEAYRQSYNTINAKPETIWNEAYKLMESPDVAARIEELKQMHLQRHIVTVDSITAELEEARQLAISIEAPAPAVSASMGKAKLHGLITEKSELTGANGGAIEILDAKATLLRGIVPNASSE